MTWDGLQERRRGIRADMGQQVDCRFEMRTRVRLVDISASGALLASDATLPVETAGRLKAVLGAGRFSPQLQVRRAANVASSGFHVGAAFLDMDEESRKSLEAFLKKATP